MTENGDQRRLSESEWDPWLIMLGLSQLGQGGEAASLLMDIGRRVAVERQVEAGVAEAHAEAESTEEAGVESVKEAGAESVKETVKEVVGELVRICIEAAAAHSILEATIVYCIKESVAAVADAVLGPAESQRDRNVNKVMEAEDEVVYGGGEHGLTLTSDRELDAFRGDGREADYDQTHEAYAEDLEIRERGDEGREITWG